MDTMNNADCIFCRIVRGELPACKIHEDKDTLAFMDIAPIIKGHALVIPKPHCVSIMDTPDELLARVIVAAREVARAQISGLKADGINVVQSNGKAANQVVPHIHFHVVPRFNDDGHSWNWTARSYADDSERELIAERIRDALQR